MLEDLSVSTLCYDDILLVPGSSRIESRSDIQLVSKLGNPGNPDGIITIPNPICIAPMEFISSTEMLCNIEQLGGMGFIHRFQDLDKKISQYEDVKSISGGERIGIAIGPSEINLDSVNKIIKSRCRIILIDIPFSHTSHAVDCVKKLRALVPSYIHIMIGNTSSVDSYLELMSAGADSVRIGIGGGAACTTRTATGFGVPVLGSVMDIYSHVEDDDVNGIVADGGVKSNGDIVKALAAGASVVMMGSLFAGYDESGERFRGLASEEMQLDNFNVEDRAKMHVEGVSGIVDARGPARVGIQRMINDIKSGLSYVGADNLDLFRYRVKFIKVSPQSLLESKSRI